LKGHAGKKNYMSEANMGF